MRGGAFALLWLALQCARADVYVATSGTFTAAYLELQPQLSQIAGDEVVTVTTSIGQGADSIPSRVARGDAIDLVILTDDTLVRLIDEGLVAADSQVELARSKIGIAVRTGTAKPDIATVDALRETLLAARSIAYSASVSGNYVSTELFARLGIADRVAAKSRRIVNERVGAVVARGEAEIGFQQISELAPIAGIEVLGPLPDEVQLQSTVSAGVVESSPRADAARAMIRYLASAEAVPTIERTGLQPLGERAAYGAGTASGAGGARSAADDAAAEAAAGARSGEAAAGARVAAGELPPSARFELPELRIVAPAAPGGGWDQTARAMQQVLERAGIVHTPIVENVPGAAGSIGLARFAAGDRGEGRTLLVSGLIMVGGLVTYRSPLTLADTTPIARLTGEYEALTVPIASPYRTLDDFISAFKARPESISWGGGSAGGSDHILAGLIAQAVGVEPGRVNYIGFAGGGEALSAVLGGQVSVGVNGLGEFASQIEAGTLRVLAISSAERLPGVDAPTLRERGVDVEFENWRSIVAPPDIDAHERRELDEAIAAMVHSAEWRETLERFRWLDRYLPGEEFARFSAAEDARVRAILERLGTGDAAAMSLGDTGRYPLFVLGGLVLFGMLAGVAGLHGRTKSPAREKRGQTPDSGPVLRDSAEAAGASHGRWRALALIGAAAALDLALVERAGFVIGSALLFWLVARAFDDRRPLRDAVCAVGVSVAAYLLFDRVLDVPLPAGALERLL